jgi:hypothetical protein
VTQKEFVSTCVVFWAVLAFIVPIVVVIPQVLRILETFWCIPPSVYRYYVVGVVISEILTYVIWFVSGIVIMTKRGKVTEWLLGKMNVTV